MRCVCRVGTLASFALEVPPPEPTDAADPAARCCLSAEEGGRVSLALVS